MPTRETWIPVLPRVTFSVGLAGRVILERMAPNVFEVAVAASAAVAVACARNSRRFRGGVICCFSPVSGFESGHEIHSSQTEDSARIIGTQPIALDRSDNGG